jgi:ParB-like chromosome segregation protein Spo0J
MSKTTAARKQEAEPAGPLQVTYRPLAELIPFARNSRTHSDAQIAQIAASIRVFSFTNPVLTDELGGIIAGHGRVLAARQLGLAEVPCIELRGLSEVQKRAYVIADNKLALNAGWDTELLAVELQGLADEGYDALLTGFDQGELDELLKGSEGADKDMLGDNGFEHESQYAVIVTAADEQEQQQIYERLVELGYTCKVVNV